MRSMNSDKEILLTHSEWLNNSRATTEAAE